MKKIMMLVMVVLAGVANLNSQSAEVVITMDDFTGELISMQAIGKSPELDVNIFYGNTGYGEYYLAQLNIPLASLGSGGVTEDYSREVDTQSDNREEIFYGTVLRGVSEKEDMLVVVVIIIGDISEINAIRVPYLSGSYGNYKNEAIIIESPELWDNLRIAFDELMIQRELHWEEQF